MATKLVDKECFPMGSCDSTLYERGWLNIACGPSITIEIDYNGHHHHPSAGQHTPLLPNQLQVEIEAPVVLLRVFGCLARDLLGLKVRNSLCIIRSLLKGPIDWACEQRRVGNCFHDILLSK